MLNGRSHRQLLEKHFVTFSSKARSIFAGLALISLVFPVRSLSPQAVAASTASAYDTSAFAALKWREIGPFRGGRSVAVAGSPSRPHEYYFGTTGGGVFKTTDGGMTWAPVSDNYFGGSVGGIGISSSNPDIVYVGTGEHTIRGNVSLGDGMFKSSDAGKTWKAIGLGDSHQISRVRVHPTDPNIVYVSVQGHVWGPSRERGVFKTTDGGATWKNVLFRNDSTGASDLVLDASNPAVLYAGMWQANRTPWKLVSGGAGSGLFKSTDAGETWTELTRNTGLPAGIIGKVGITVSPVKPARLWALIEADSGGVFRSDDAGATWTKMNTDRRLRQRAWYYTKIFADPKDSNTVYALNTGLYRSTDGGKTFRPIQVPHGDNHDLWIAPNDPQRMINGNDGGANVSFTAGRTWTEQDYATAQFYHVTTTNHFPYRVCGSQQDNSTLCGPSRSDGGIDNDQWYGVGGGESGYIAVRPDSPNVVYAGSYGGYLTRFDENTRFTRDVNPWPDNPMGHDAADARYRFQWTFPIVISPHDPKTLYVGSSVVFKSTNNGQSFSAISPDLTRHDPRTLGASGGPITKDQTSVEYYATVFTIAESPRQAGVIWAGSDDGLVHVTRDAGKSWTNVTPPGMPDFARVSLIEVSPHSPGTAYVAANRYQMDDLKPYIYRTTDFGKTWTFVVNGIPATEFVRVVREDPVRRGLLYAGTERSVWISFNEGATWQSLRRNLPLVPVHDFAVREGDLIAATHGRSFWILDDLSALRQLNQGTTARSAQLFKPRNVYRADFRGGGGTGAAGGHPSGQNPPNGAVVYYWLKDKNQTVTLEFLDSKGSLIRKFTSIQDSTVRSDSLRTDSIRRNRDDSLRRAGVNPDSARRTEARSEETPAEDGPRRTPPPPRVPDKTGLNSFAWNLYYPELVSFENLIMWAAGTQGAMALPGNYSVRMTVGNAPPQTQSFTLVQDPRSDATQADLVEQFNFLKRIGDRVNEANNAVRTIRNLRAQLVARNTGLSDSQKAELDGVSSGMMTRLGAIEAEIYQVKNQSGQDPLNYPIR
ncbi:MAG: glycosyl hydrolase, partial [Gemmatimonadaceae bacterium]|nr:glycosyl hydrolase [Gemmatimonadaceae bacterium]